MPNRNARRSATCSLLAALGRRLGVVRLHRHRRHDDRFFRLGLLRVGGGRRRLWPPLRPWSSGRASRLCARRRECSACRPGSASRPPLLSWPAPPWPRPASRGLRRGFSFGCRSAAAPPCFSPRAIAIMSATLGLAASRPVSSPAAAAASRRRRRPLGRCSFFGRRRRLARRRTALVHRLCERRPTSRPPSSCFCRPSSVSVPECARCCGNRGSSPSAVSKAVEGSAGDRQLDALSRAGPDLSPAILYAATGYRKPTGPARSGDCDIFHNLLYYCLWSHGDRLSTAVSEFSTDHRARNRDSPREAEIGKDQIVYCTRKLSRVTRLSACRRRSHTTIDVRHRGRGHWASPVRRDSSTSGRSIRSCDESAP